MTRSGRVVAAGIFVIALAAATGLTWSGARQADPAEATRVTQDVEDGEDGETQEDDLVARGEALYRTSCASCHGPDGTGVRGSDDKVRGPAITEAGEASAYFYLVSGRMPMATSEGRAVRKPPAFDDAEIDALVAYVASLGNGPALPEVDLTAGKVDGGLGEGGVLYRENCQACHGAAGSGGALSYGHAAPKLSDATPEEVAAAVRIGPGQMPVFGSEVFDGRQLDQLAAYVEYLREPEDPGGVPIGRTGPMPEGFVIWVAGIGALLGCVAWIGTRSPVRARLKENET